MASSGNDFHLWIARDADKVIVALCPLKVGGRGYRHEWGSITDVTAKKTRAGRGNGAAIILLTAGASVFIAVGVHWLLAVGLVLIPATVIAQIQARKEQPGAAIAPDLNQWPDLHRVLETRQERSSFLDLVRQAERVGKTLPALEGLVEPTGAGELLAQTVWEGAKILARGQEVRAILDDLGRHDPKGLPASSRAVQDLISQRDKAMALEEEADADLARLTANLEAAALAGENLIREREMRKAARRAEEALVDLIPPDLADGSGASEQLADETVAVLEAYRELTDLYGGEA